MVFTIDGFDITPYIAENGIKWTANGVDGPNAGRAMNALMYRGLVAYKARCDVACLWMDKNAAKTLYSKVMKEFFTVVTDTIPWINGTATKTMYSNEIGIVLSTEYTDGAKLYQDMQFPLIER